MHNHTGKTKTAMLQELESIKGLLIEEDDIPILQEVIAEEIPVLDMIVQPEDLPEEAIPLLVSVVVDEDELSEQAPAFQPQFAAQEDIPEWSENFIDTGVSLESEMSLDTEIPLITEVALKSGTYPEPKKLSDDAAVAQPEHSFAFAAAPEVQTSSWDEPELPLGDIPTLTVDEKDLDVFDNIEAFDNLDANGNLNTLSNIETTAKEKLEETTEAAAVNLQPETPQHRTEQQQDFFQIIEEIPSEPLPHPASTNRPAPVKPAGENPFLPEHIRARLQSNNTEAQTGDIHSKRFKALSLGSIHSPSQNTNKPSPIQQQLINEIMDKMLPEMARELRARLEQMNKKMLEELLAER